MSRMSILHLSNFAEAADRTRIDSTVATLDLAKELGHAANPPRLSAHYNFPWSDMPIYGEHISKASSSKGVISASTPSYSGCALEISWMSL